MQGQSQRPDGPVPAAGCQGNAVHRDTRGESFPTGDVYNKFELTDDLSNNYILDQIGKFYEGCYTTAEDLSSDLLQLSDSTDWQKVICNSGTVDFDSLKNALNSTSAQKLSLDLTAVTGEGVSIPEGAFSGCTKLKEIFLGVTSMEQFYESDFNNYSSIKSVNNLLYDIKDLFKDKYNIKDIDCIDIDVKSSEKYISDPLYNGKKQRPFLPRCHAPRSL